MGPNVLGAVAQAVGTGNALAGFQRQKRLDDVYSQHGQGIAAGDQNALNALASVDPMAALGVRDARQTMDLRAQQEQRMQGQFELQVQEYAAGLDAREAARQAEEIKRGVFAASGAQTPEEWDAIVTGLGQTDLVGQFERRDPLLRQYMTAAQVLEQQAGPRPQSGPGKVQADIEAGLLPEGTQLRSPQIVVNTGDQADMRPIVDKPPKGFQRVYDAERGTYVDQPIPGGQIETERSGAARKAELASSDYRRKSDIVNSNIDRALEMLEQKGRMVAGYGSLLSGLPESDARDFQAVLDTVKANLGFEELQAMRDASPTGGALGAVTEREIAFLQAIQGNLDSAQSPQRLQEVLQEIRDRRAEFAQEREEIMSRNQTASGAADLERRVREMPDFGSMSDEDLDRWIMENGQ